jgi:DNA invertase Pin-like site-specific DNA recombinase
MKKVIYSRISTATQNNEIQSRDGIKVYSDICSGSIPFKERTEAKKLIKDLNTIDCIEVASIDRLGRNTVDVLQTLEFFADNGKQVIARRENLVLLDDNGKVNTVTKLILSILCSVAEMERQRIKERTAEGIANAKAKGVYLGRAAGSIESNTKFLAKYPKVIKALKDGRSVRSIANDKRLDCSHVTVSKIKQLID